MARFTSPVQTRGMAPSHSPPDMQFAPGRELANFLGWFSIGLGVLELAAPKAVAAATGVNNSKLIALYGIREIVCGVGILASKQPAPWLWCRVAGDVLDLATLAAAEEGQGMPGVAAAAVAGVTALDVLSATQLTAAAAMEG